MVLYYSVLCFVYSYVAWSQHGLDVPLCLVLTPVLRFVSSVCLLVGSSVKTLGEAEEDDDVLNWVSKSRALEEEKRKAEKKVILFVSTVNSI